MAELDKNYINASDLQSAFRDKDTSLPLSGGTIKFYQDQNRIQPKRVYTLSGAPPNYTYTSLGTTVTLNAAGYVDLPIFYYILDQDGEEQLYYIEVYNAAGVLQFTRKAWPNSSIFSSDSPDDGSSSIDALSIIPNGQFLFNFPPVKDIYTGYGENQLRLDSTLVALGGYYIHLPVAPSGPDDFYKAHVYFKENLQPSTQPLPSANPQTILNYVMTDSPGGLINDLRVRIDNVNTFHTALLGRTFNFNFEVKSNLTPIEATAHLVKNFGAGSNSPSPETDTIISSTIAITNEWQAFSVNFDFGDNSGFVVGNEGNSYLELCLRFQTTGFLDVEMVNFWLEEGPERNIPTEYPEETNLQTTYTTLSASQDPLKKDGYDLYLPMMMNKHGITYDRSVIGNIYPTTRSTPAIWEVECKGGISSIVDRHLQGSGLYTSNDLVPWSRLYEAINSPDNPTYPIPPWGTSQVTWFSTVYVAGLVKCFSNQFSPLTTLTGQNGAGMTFVFTEPTPGEELNIQATGAADIPQGGTITINFSNQPKGPITVLFNIDNNYLVPTPVPGDTVLIVNILSTDLQDDVSEKLAWTLNGYAFEIPDLRGQFLRGYDEVGFVDPQTNIRVPPYPLTTGLSNNVPGSKQDYQVGPHNHTINGIGPINADGSSGGRLGQSGTKVTNENVGVESRPINVAIRYFMHI